MAPHTPRLGGVRRRVRSARRAVLARRRPLAALLATAAVLVGLRTVAPPPATTGVLVAARDLPAGTTLTTDDLTTAAFADGTAPSALAEEPVGRTLAAPVAAGEPITGPRLLGDGLAAAHEGLAVLPVRLSDAGAAALLRPGDHIDLLATAPSGDTRTVAEDVRVITLGPEGEGDSRLTGRLVVIGVTEGSRELVASASVSEFLSYTYSG
ncbi:pilus assembly protein CpaB [Nocardioides gansuensis]|uniref:Pilus assembly protein CpaB n=1 Tax=Nocardioides gansuensis TaxID=2138300 RepID=A0A2T8F675_9ACTN|nr:SAF domain-containing protein [Nocardioides gansuensis]PVG81212.1 pilus assembly protein CpaB [Nocardioides gansuensis]